MFLPTRTTSLIVTSASKQSIPKQIAKARCEDQGALWANFKRKNDPKATKKLSAQLQTSLAEVERLSQLDSHFDFPAALPITARKDEIIEAIQTNQILVLAGETGSGKTTQLPRMCLQAGFGCRGLIGHTQPRRIAARTVASRIAQEMRCELGTRVGYQVRFKDVSSADTQIKLMTDGVLLAELQNDRWLSRYEVIIIDEAHERSLNIDFLLGLLKPLLKKRRDLKLIITSATIDLDTFTQYFATGEEPAPLIEVSGRTYPVDVVYSDSDDQTSEQELSETIADTAANIIEQDNKGKLKASGDILVFCSGEREIRDAARVLRSRNLAVDVLPLYARLSIAEQNRVFQPSQRRKVVLATNVAETSITVPGIAYVIDPGFARISQYNFRAKIQSLPIEPISQASANQRMGRCGRVQHGICYRLYSKENFAARIQFTPAEILRSNLSSVILRMKRLGINDPKHFDFVDQPDSRLIKDAVRELEELGAVNKKQQLTSIGRTMSDLPLEPRLARLLIEASKSDFLIDAIVVAAGLSIRAIADSKSENDKPKIAPAVKHSDFANQLLLWETIEQQRQALSNKEFKQLCEQQKWSIQRIFEWRDLVRQIKGVCATQQWNKPTWQPLNLDPLDKEFKNQLEKSSNRYQTLHRAVTAGFLSNVLNRDVEGNYVGTRSKQVLIGRESALTKTKASWVIAAELAQTNKVYARGVAEIDPMWIIDLAGKQLKYTYSEPHFNATKGRVIASRKTLFLGLTLKTGERVNYGPINKSEARKLFIQQALVEGQYHPTNTLGDCILHNRRLRDSLDQLEIKTRRRNLSVSDETLYELYEQRVPDNVADVPSLEKWLKTPQKQSLEFSLSDLSAEEPDPNLLKDYPDFIDINGRKLALSYRFAPADENDGVTMHVPVELLAPLAPHFQEWIVPGLVKEKAAALIKTLPKPVRQQFTPAYQVVERVYEDLKPEQGFFSQQLADALHGLNGTRVLPAQWDNSKLPHFLKVTFSVEDSNGRAIDQGISLVDLKRRYADKVSESMHANQAPEKVKYEQTGVSDWSVGNLLESVQYTHQGMTIVAYPMFVANPDGSVDLRLSESADIAAFTNINGVARLIVNSASAVMGAKTFNLLSKQIGGALTSQQTEEQRSKPKGGLANQLKALQSTVITPSLILSNNETIQLVSLALSMATCEIVGREFLPKSAGEFERASKKVAAKLSTTALDIAQLVGSILKQQSALLQKCAATKAESIELDAALEDAKEQLYRLGDLDTLSVLSVSDLKQYARILKAIEHRLERLAQVSDSAVLKQLRLWHDRELAAIEGLSNEPIADGILDASQARNFAHFKLPILYELSWMLEEWRVSLFAQHLKTRYPVSEQRIGKLWKEIDLYLKLHLGQNV